jgi:GTPase SAR1 family protein
MDTKHTDALHKEAIRLLEFQCALLRKLLATPGLLKDSATHEKSSLTLQRAREDMQVLEGELDKLQELDMVLAVVGTMKSGKSTTNNAIVGLEVLPNRNRPMTALPTLIRHTPGAQIPELYFQKNGQLNKLIAELKEKLSSSEGRQLLEQADQREDLVKVADNILAGFGIEDRYKNENGIFEFLKSLNDLVRLSTALDVEFPFEEFQSVKDLPVIEVEFQHLRDNGLGHGRLSLLDTPGPNEEGQFALKPMMKEQLRRASGVIAVLDYTQLKSESDAEVRRELLEIAEVSRGRLSILVNKFDQKDRNSDDAETVKDMVANQLLKGRISEDDVYPVSSRYAYLANRARTDLAVQGKLSSHKQEAWVVDFAEEGLGRRWERDIDDVEKVAEAIDILWEDSLFDEPLTHVIQKAHSQAAVMAIDAASSKLVDSGNRVNNFLGLRETALQKSKEELQKNINNLKRQAGQVDELEKRSRQDIEQFEKQLKSDMDALARQAEQYLHKSLEGYFKEGRISAHKDKQLADQSRKRAEPKIGGFGADLGSLFAGVDGSSSRSSKRNQDFDPEQNEIKFSSRSRAQELLDNIFNATRQQYEQVQESMSKSVDSLHQNLDLRSKQLEQNALDILNAVSAEMSKEDFELRLRLPHVKPISIDFSSHKVLDDMVETETRTESRRRRSSGVWGTVCSWFNTDDWGYESYSVEKDYYKVNLKKIRKQTLDGAKKIFINANQSIELNIIKPVEASCADFFVELNETIDEIRGDLLAGLHDSNRTKAEQEDLAIQLAALKIENSDSTGDMEQLKNDTDGMLGSKGGQMAVTA